MSERHVISKVAGEAGFEDAVAEVLTDVHPGDVIAVPDAESEKRVREAAVKFGFGVDEDGGDLGIGFEIAPATEEVEFDEAILEYAVQGETESAIKVEVYDKLAEPFFDSGTIFVVANREELAWVFEAASARRTDIALNAETGREARELGDIRATVAMSNVIVTNAEDFPAPPKLSVKIDAQNLAEGIKESLKDAGFAIGYKERKGVLRAMFDGENPHTPTRIWLAMPGEEPDVVIGDVGEDIAIALPLPPGEGPDLKLTAVKPESGVESPKLAVEATPEYGTEAGPQGEVPESGPPSENAPDPARTEGKNVIDG